MERISGAVRMLSVAFVIVRGSLPSMRGEASIHHRATASVSESASQCVQCAVRVLSVCSVQCAVWVHEYRAATEHGKKGRPISPQGTARP